MSQKTPNKILMLNLTSVGHGEGGAIHQLNLLKNFKETGYTVNMIAPKRKGGSSKHYSTFAENIYLHPSFENTFLPITCDTFLQIPYLILFRLLGKANMLYIRANTFSWLPILIARLLLMYCVVEHNSWMASERKTYKNTSKLAIFLDFFGQVMAAKLAHKSRCVTEGIKRKLLENGVSKRTTFVVGNGCDTSKFTPLPSDKIEKILGPSPDQTIIGYIGGLVEWQGVETLIEAFSILRQKHSAALVIAGSGPLEEKLKTHSKNLNIKDVYFLGYVGSEKACNIINNFDIATAPFTKNRNAEIGLSPIKIRDYAASGIPVVSSNIDGIVQLEKHGWLFTYDADNPKDLAAKLSDLIDDKENRKAAGVKAREYAINHFDWKSIANEVLLNLKS